MWITNDPDEWETVAETKTVGHMFGHPIGSCSVTMRHRDPAEVAKIKEAKRLEHEEAILAEADAIRKRRLAE